MRIEDKIKQHLRLLGCATRPALATALGYSKVYINRVMEGMLHRGEIRCLDQVDKTAGRPAQLYELQASAEHFLLLRLHEEGKCLLVLLDLLDAKAEVLVSHRFCYAEMVTDSFSALLEPYAALALRAVVLCVPEHYRFSGLRALVQRCCGCPLRLLDPMEALADRQEGSVSIFYRLGCSPQALMAQDAVLRRMGALDLLPTPIAWEDLKDGDNATIEEMVALMVLYLCCVLAPTRVCLYADFWQPRLESRIRYNCKIKLRDRYLPPLELHPCTSDEALMRLRRLACQVV